MHASFIVRCFLLVASATALSARPVTDGPARATAEHLASPVQGGDQHSHRYTEGYHAGNLDHHRPEHQEHYTHSHRPTRTEVTARELPMLEMIARDVARSNSGYAARSFEDEMDLVSRSLERRHKKKETKTEPPKPATTTHASSAPNLPSKPKKHHVNMHKVGSVVGKVGKGLLRLFLRDDDPELYARLFEDDETLGLREDVAQELRRRILDALD